MIKYFTVHKAIAKSDYLGALPELILLDDSNFFIFPLAAVIRSPLVLSLSLAKLSTNRPSDDQLVLVPIVADFSAVVVFLRTAVGTARTSQLPSEETEPE